ncbi:MAG: hypothetical protein WD424_05710 [Paenibacillaceae bacterium]
MKKHLIYKTDKWNMMTVEVKGRTLTLREISDQWGEECHTFVSRPEMMNWVNQRFTPASYMGKEEEYNQIITAFRDI